MDKQDDPLVKAFKELRLKPGVDTWDIVFKGVKRGIAVKHKALEKIAAAKQMSFDNPIIIETDATNRICVLSVRGHIGDRSEWAIGEAAPYNIDKGTNKQSYPYAMAEKRAKDRVILKLLNVAGDYYSEAESEDFKEEDHKNKEPLTKQQPEPAAEKDPEPDVKGEIQEWASKVNEDVEKPGKYSADQLFIDQYNRIIDDLDNCKQVSHLNTWVQSNRVWLDRFKTDKPKDYEEILSWHKVKKAQIASGNLSSIREEIPI